jgi:hypothetical protein
MLSFYRILLKSIITSLIIVFIITNSFSQSYKIVSTGQMKCYDTTKTIVPPVKGAPFFGQDAQFQYNKPNYTDNGNGTITDNITGLMWQKSPDFNNDGFINSLDKKSYSESLSAADTFKLAGYTDWRLPTTKELYSLFMAYGTDPSGPTSVKTLPFIDTSYFPFGYGDEVNGERQIDAQYAASTIYVGKVFETMTALFGVNFADGRIKGYPNGNLPNGQAMKFYVKYVRGPKTYGINEFVDNKNGTISDKATDLMWSQTDSKTGMNWLDALAWVQKKNTESYLGYNDWRLPNVKELQSLIDYTKSPTTSNSAAIDPLFECTKITVEQSKLNYPFYWTSTTHVSANGQAPSAMYVCFGQAFGFMEFPPNSGNRTLTDVHGAGAQRSDPKAGNPADFPIGRGPQGDVIRINNFVRLVRNINQTSDRSEEKSENLNISPNPASDYITISHSALDAESTLEIFNIFGEKTTPSAFQAATPYPSTSTGTGNLRIDISNLSPGVYFIRIGDRFEKFVKM